MSINFGRFTGTLYWGCPVCNAIHKNYMKADTKEIKCPNCESVWIPGLTIWRKPRGPTRVPKDTLLIGEGFAVRRLANRCYCEGCGKALWESPEDDSNLTDSSKTPPV